jgi:threonine synthase
VPTASAGDAAIAANPLTASKAGITLRIFSPKGRIGLCWFIALPSAQAKPKIAFSLPHSVAPNDEAKRNVNFLRRATSQSSEKCL